MAYSYQQSEQESEEEEKDSAMAALMRSTDEGTEANCEIVRDVTESQRTKKETVLKFEEMFGKVERKGESIEQIQAEHDEKTF